MTLTAFYDLAVGPVSFDFAVFLVKAELARRKAKAKRLHVVIVPDAKGVGGMFRDKTALYDEAEMRWRLWNICIPACQLLGASVTLATGWMQAMRLAENTIAHEVYRWPPDWDRQTLKDRQHLVGSLIAAAKSGDEIPRFQASGHARRAVRAHYKALGAPVVTMTWRSTYLPARNSSAEDWLKARDHIEARGFKVKILRDTGAALAEGAGYGELNLDLRMACYEEAALNLQANNGAASLCWFSERPYRMFGAGVPAEEWDGLFVRQGLPLGQTWPWAKPGQKIVYGPARPDQIVAEFEAWAGATS